MCLEGPGVFFVEVFRDLFQGVLGLVVELKGCSRDWFLESTGTKLHLGSSPSVFTTWYTQVV
jgi:hypothetical protein